MRLSQAWKILGLNGTENEREVKKKYHKLMHDYHPDSNKSKNSEFAAKINRAYELIMADFSGQKNNKTVIKNKPKTKNWNAKENKNAYTRR